MTIPCRTPVALGARCGGVITASCTGPARAVALLPEWHDLVLRGLADRGFCALTVLHVEVLERVLFVLDRGRFLELRSGAHGQLRAHAVGRIHGLRVVVVVEKFHWLQHFDLPWAARGAEGHAYPVRGVWPPLWQRWCLLVLLPFTGFDDGANISLVQLTVRAVLIQWASKRVGWGGLGCRSGLGESVTRTYRTLAPQRMEGWGGLGCRSGLGRAWQGRTERDKDVQNISTITNGNVVPRAHMGGHCKEQRAAANRSSRRGKHGAPQQSSMRIDVQVFVHWWRARCEWWCTHRTRSRLSETLLEVLPARMLQSRADAAVKATSCCGCGLKAVARSGCLGGGFALGVQAFGLHGP